MSTETKPDTKAEDVPFAEQTALTEFLGNNPKVKIMIVLLSEGRDVNVSHIAEQAGMSRSTVYDHIDALLSFGAVEKTREISGSPLYQVNRDSEIAKNFGQLQQAVNRWMAAELEE